MLTWTRISRVPQPEIKVHLEFRFNPRSVLLDFQSFTEKPFLECAFTHPIMLFLSYLVKNSIDLGDLQISSKMAFTVPVRQLTVSF